MRAQCATSRVSQRSTPPLTKIMSSGEEKITVPSGSLIMANVFLSTMGTSGGPVWHYKLLGVTHVEDRDQDGMEMQTV